MTTEPEKPTTTHQDASRAPAGANVKFPIRINALNVLVTAATIAFLACGSLLIARSRFGPPQPMGPPPGAGPADLRVCVQIPDFPIRKFGSGEWQKLSQMPSKITMINFWASWCEACIQEMPSIIKLRQEYKDKGFALVAINLDESPEAAVPKVLRKLKIDFPVYTDPEGKIAEIFDVHAIPLTIILDSQRRILMFENSELDWDSADVKAKIEKWLQG